MKEQKVHYVVTKIKTSGHVRSICGIWFNERDPYDDGRYSEDLDKVKCKRCLKAMGR